MKRSTARISALICLAAISLFLGGCASPTQPAAMVASPELGVAKKHAATVNLHVSGGKETNPNWTSQISDADFTKAIEDSIRQSGLFSGMAAADTAPYHLEVQLVRVQQPLMGFSMTVTVEVNWILKRHSDNTVVWQKAVVSNFTATTGDAFAGVKRLRLATEGAARKNIEEALKEISGLNLES